MYYNPEIKDRNFSSKWLSLRILASKASQPKKYGGPGAKPPGKFLCAKKRIGEGGVGSQIFEKRHDSVTGGGGGSAKSERHVIFGAPLSVIHWYIILDMKEL